MKHAHRLTQVDETALTGCCAACGPVRLYRRTGGGFMCAPAQLERMERYRTANREKRRESNRLSARPYLVHRDGACERCGRVPLFDSALSVHHRDFDHDNNDPANLATLCLTCHAEVHALHRLQEEASLVDPLPAPPEVNA